MTELRGAYTALITPFDLSGENLDLFALERLLGSQAEGGIRGVVPCGTTGEAPSLDRDEYRVFVERTVEVGHALGMEVIPGAGSNTTAQAVENNRIASRLGADGALHVTPYYNRPSQEGLYAHFMAVADSSDHPIIIYDVPGRTGIRIAPETIIRLADHPNIRGVKAAGGSIDDVSEVILGCDLAVLSGDDTLTLPMMSVGARGVISVLSNIMPATVSALCTSAHDGRWEDARALHRRSYPVARALLQLDSNPIPVKTALEALGLCSGSLRLPLVPPGREIRVRIEQMLVDSGIDQGAEVVKA